MEITFLRLLMFRQFIWLVYLINGIFFQHLVWEKRVKFLAFLAPCHIQCHWCGRIRNFIMRIYLMEVLIRLYVCKTRRLNRVLINLSTSLVFKFVRIRFLCYAGINQLTAGEIDYVVKVRKRVFFGFFRYFCERIRQSFENKGKFHFLNLCVKCALIFFFHIDESK